MAVRSLEGAADLEAELEGLIQIERTTAFDISRPPLWRATLVRLGPLDHALLITMHHLVFDGWSGTIFYAELCKLYSARIARQTTDLPPIRAQYCDYAAWHNRVVDSGAFDRDCDYFKQVFRHPPTRIELPYDHSRPSEFSYRGDIVHAVAIGVSGLAELEHMARQSKATTFHVVCAACMAMVYSFSEQTDITVGTVSAGQCRRDLAWTLGFFTNTVPIRLQCDPSMSWRDLLVSVRRAIAGAMAHENYPFDRLVEELDLPIDRSRSPLFDVLIIYQNFRNIGAAEVLPSGIRAVQMPQKLVRSLYDLKLEFTPSDEGLLLNCEYNTDLFLPSTADRMVKRLESLLVQVVADPSVCLNRLTFEDIPPCSVVRVR
jgi:hypothetical protein